MQHRIENEGSVRTAEYQWQLGGRWCHLSAQTVGIPTQPPEGSLEQFITEHYWGYSAQRPWFARISRLARALASVGDPKAGFEGDANILYGANFQQFFSDALIVRLWQMARP